MFYLKSIDWGQFSKLCGFTSYSNQREYDFALSFAGVDRDIAENMASLLKGEGFNVFYDQDFSDKLWGG